VDLRAADRVFPLLGLQIDRFQAETILIDEPVDARISPLASQSAGGVSPAAVSHRPHEVEDNLLEKLR